MINLTPFGGGREAFHFECIFVALMWNIYIYRFICKPAMEQLIACGKSVPHTTCVLKFYRSAISMNVPSIARSFCDRTAFPSARSHFQQFYQNWFVSSVNDRIIKENKLVEMKCWAEKQIWYEFICAPTRKIFHSYLELSLNFPKLMSNFGECTSIVVVFK